jgi:hypothetical protein
MKMIYIISYENQPITHKNIYGLLNFCKNKKNDDIICVVQNESDIKDITKKYYLYKNSIVFAENVSSGNEKMANPFIFVGSCKNIVDFWQHCHNMESYVYNKIKNQEKSTIYDDDFIIDTEHEVFHPTCVNPFIEKFEYIYLAIYIVIVLVLVVNTEPIVVVF